jgi:acyl carrier protein
MKQKLIAENKVFENVKNAILETLNVDESTISPDSSLVRDLGAESLDFLDINYRLEQKFGIKLARHFVLEHIEDMFGEGSAIDENGQLTEKAVQVLKIRLGDQVPDLKPGVDMDEITQLITVQSIVNGVLDIIDTLPETCSHCGNAGWKSEDSTRIRCGSCGEYALFTEGDKLVKEWLKKVQEEKKVF